MWILVDVNFGLMDGFYCKETHSKHDLHTLCEQLNRRFPGANFIPAFTETKGAMISDFCMHNSVSHIPMDLYGKATSFRRIRTDNEMPVVVVSNQKRLRFSDTTSTEDAVLGSILLSTKLPEIVTSLTTSHFSDERIRFSLDMCLPSRRNGICVAQIHGAFW